MANHLPHPVDFGALGLDEPLRKLKYIGAYIAGRFVAESVWPVNSRNVHPIHTLRDLHSFFRQRRPVPTARANITTWLERIMANDRPRQCVEKGKDIPPGNHRHLYHVRDVNECGFNVIVGFLNYHFPDPPHRAKIPRAKTGRAFYVKYPLVCREQP